QARAGSISLDVISPGAWCEPKQVPFGAAPDFQMELQIGRVAVHFQNLSDGQFTEGASQENRHAFLESQIFEFESGLWGILRHRNGIASRHCPVAGSPSPGPPASASVLPAP